MSIVRYLQKTVRLAGIEITRERQPVKPEIRLFDALTKLRESLTEQEYEFLRFCVQNMRRSKAQIFQDMFALFALNQKRNGFFVEFGATNGIHNSNTLLLEQEYGWNGILAEPARVWHSSLKGNRSCAIDTRCVWSASGKTVEFDEANDAQLSTISSFTHADSYTRTVDKRYKVETVTLQDLLREHHAPANIDFMSIDTEGSEPTILGSFDFAAYQISAITVEHAYGAIREPLRRILTGAGFIQVFPNFSLHDDWYVNPTLPKFRD